MIGDRVKSKTVGCDPDGVRSTEANRVGAGSNIDIIAGSDIDRAANEVFTGTGSDLNAVGGIAEIERNGRIGADGISLHAVVPGASVQSHDDGRTGCNDVAVSWESAADRGIDGEIGRASCREEVQ